MLIHRVGLGFCCVLLERMKSHFGLSVVKDGFSELDPSFHHYGYIFAGKTTEIILPKIRRKLQL